MNTLIHSVLSLLFSLSGEPEIPIPAVAPPTVDYCEYLEQEVNGIKHGFLAGNNTYYIGGRVGTWDLKEYETIGFTHPIHDDLRSRGHGMVQDPDTGYGNDVKGWAFHKDTKVAYGTVIINGTRYENPIPTSMVWRPDRMICEYLVGGVTIREDKFIALNDTLCSIITSSAPVTLEFTGQSFYKDSITVYSSATCTYDSANNAVHLIESGINLVHPNKTRVPQEGIMMYEGMSVILSASRTLENYTNSTDPENTGQQHYSFTVPCDSDGTSLTWTMEDDASLAFAEAQAVLADSAGALQAKTDHMNTLLNEQVPYFRCSDEEINEVYYYLWAMFMVYMKDLSDDGTHYYAHTQTAVNNFRGMYRNGAQFAIPTSAWLADKEYYAHAAALHWKTLLDEERFDGLTTIKDSGEVNTAVIGQTWITGHDGSITSHPKSVWKIYQHSGDLVFLAEIYDFYNQVFANTIKATWGFQYGAADALYKMALELGLPQSEADAWHEKVDYANRQEWLAKSWEKEYEYWYGGDTGTRGQLGWVGFAYLWVPDFPRDWARQMVERWAMNDVDGFLWEGVFRTDNVAEWEEQRLQNPNFMIAPNPTWFALTGMFDTGVYDHAVTLTVNSLKRYNYHPEYGIPCAAEALGELVNDDTGASEGFDFHGNQYSNINAGNLLLILEGLCGLSYSVAAGSFTVADNLPPEWTFMETYIPMAENGQDYWTRVRVEREEQGGVVTKSVQVEGNKQATLNIEPWMEGKTLQSATAGGVTNAISGHIEYQFSGQEGQLIQIQLTD